MTLLLDYFSWGLNHQGVVGVALVSSVLAFFALGTAVIALLERFGGPR